MKEDFTYIAVVLDKSGSMAGVTDDTIGGFNAFLKKQQGLPGRAQLMLVQFADTPEYVISRDVKDIHPLNHSTYIPDGGSTALYDAIGSTIDNVGAILAKMPEAERPGRVLILIQTDGLENSSRYYKAERVAKMIKHQREKYNWNFAFIGASEAAITDAVRLNIPVNFTAQYAPTPEGTAQVLYAASASVGAYRGMSTNEIKTKGGALSFF